MILNTGCVTTRYRVNVAWDDSPMFASQQVILDLLLVTPTPSDTSEPRHDHLDGIHWLFGLLGRNVVDGLSTSACAPPPLHGAHRHCRSVSSWLLKPPAPRSVPDNNIGFFATSSILGVSAAATSCHHGATAFPTLYRILSTFFGLLYPSLNDLSPPPSQDMQEMIPPHSFVPSSHNTASEAFQSISRPSRHSGLPLKPPKDLFTSPQLHPTVGVG